MKLTKQNIHAALNWGSPNKGQCKLLGVTYPLPNGWLRALIGTEMPDADYERLCSLRKKGKGLQDRPAATAEEINPDYIRVSFEQGESIDSLAKMFHKKPVEIESLLRRGIIDQHAKLVKANTLLHLKSPEQDANELFEQSGRDLS